MAGSLRAFRVESGNAAEWLERTAVRGKSISSPTRSRRTVRSSDEVKSRSHSSSGSSARSPRSPRSVPRDEHRHHYDAEEPPIKKSRMTPRVPPADGRYAAMSHFRRFPTYPSPVFSPGGRMQSRYYGPDGGGGAAGVCSRDTSIAAPPPPPPMQIASAYPHPHPHGHGHGHPHGHGHGPGPGHGHGAYGPHGPHYTNHYHMSQVLYVPYNMVYQDTPGHPNSSSSPDQEESAYDCFMAKSNDKPVDKN